MVPGTMRRLCRNFNGENGRCILKAVRGQCRSFAALPQEAFESEEKIRVTVTTINRDITLMYARAL